MSKSLADRKRLIFEKRLCFACLSPTTENHRAENCPQRKVCLTCNESHPTCLHLSVSTIRQPTPGSVTSMPIVPVVVHHKDHPDQCVIVYAMLDHCSEGTFIHESVLESLTAPSRPACVSVSTLNAKDTSQCLAVNGLYITALPDHQSKYGSKSLKLPTCYTKSYFPVDFSDIPSPESLTPWPYLARIAESFRRQQVSTPIGLLIGGDCTKVLEPHEVILSEGDGPYAFRSCLGWCVVGPVIGPVGPLDDGVVKCNLTAVRVLVKDAATNEAAPHHFAVTNTVKEHVVSDQLIKEMFMHDFNEAQPEKKAMSVEDQKFLNILDEGVIKEDDGHYCLPLPFRNPDVVFPNNRAQAVSRAEGSLKRKMKKDQAFCSEYMGYMKRVIDEGCAIKVPDAEKNDPNVWYIPHHAVFYPTKGKMRVVMDCAAKYKGRSLNDELLQGPDLAKLLVGVLIRFRKEEIAVQADLKWMFFQVRVPSCHQKFLRFVFWPDGNLDSELEDYQMCVHLFGARSSTSCCIYALRRAAYDNEDKFSQAVLHTILNSFYVDDLLKSYPSVEEAVVQVKEVVQLCGDSGFDLTKFVSNSQDFMQSLPDEKKANSTLEKDIGASIQVERALGTLWYIEMDTLGFRISMATTPYTRRGMLSTIQTSYDLWGGAGPLVIKGKRILQDVNNEKKDWDEQAARDRPESHHPLHKCVKCLLWRKGE